MDKIHEELKRPVINRTTNVCTESSSDTESSPSKDKGGDGSSDGIYFYCFYLFQ